MQCKRSSYTSKKLGRSIRSKAGVTIVEAMVALSIFAVFITGTCKLMVMHRKTLDMARDQYTAVNIAKNRLELARAFDFDQIPELNESPVTVDFKGIPSQDGLFQRTTTVTVLNTNLYELVINVSAKNRETLTFKDSGQTINTYISKHL